MVVKHVLGRDYIRTAWSSSQIFTWRNLQQVQGISREDLVRVIPEVVMLIPGVVRVIPEWVKVMLEEVRVMLEGVRVIAEER